MYRILPLYHPINMPFTNHLRICQEYAYGVWIMEYISLVQSQNGLLTSSFDVCIIQFSSYLSIVLPMAPYYWGFTWLVIVVLVDSSFIVLFSWVINWVISCLKVVPNSWYIAPYLILIESITNLKTLWILKMSINLGHSTMIRLPISIDTIFKRK